MDGRVPGIIQTGIFSKDECIKGLCQGLRPNPFSLCSDQIHSNSGRMRPANAAGRIF
jgi:hypothetical protein